MLSSCYPLGLGLGFLKDDRRLCVALSRARNGLLILSSLQELQSVRTTQTVERLIDAVEGRAVKINPKGKAEDQHKGANFNAPRSRYFTFGDMTNFNLIVPPNKDILKFNPKEHDRQQFKDSRRKTYNETETADTSAEDGAATDKAPLLWWLLPPRHCPHVTDRESSFFY